MLQTIRNVRLQWPKNSWKKSKKLFESVIIVTAPRKLIFNGFVDLFCFTANDIHAKWAPKKYRVF